jgi:hypothetical protein
MVLKTPLPCFVFRIIPDVLPSHCHLQRVEQTFGRSQTILCSDLSLVLYQKSLISYQKFWVMHSPCHATPTGHHNASVNVESRNNYFVNDIVNVSPSTLELCGCTKNLQSSLEVALPIFENLPGQNPIAHLDPLNEYMAKQDIPPHLQ